KAALEQRLNIVRPHGKKRKAADDATEETSGKRRLPTSDRMVPSINSPTAQNAQCTSKFSTPSV
ncbi:hypothetical protein ACC760_37860, partial [Rhizobium ruizarguesonis]